MSIVRGRRHQACHHRDSGVGLRTEENGHNFPNSHSDSNLIHCCSFFPVSTVTSPQMKNEAIHTYIYIHTSIYIHLYIYNNCFDISLQRVFTNIYSTTDFCTLCKRVSRFSVEKILSHSAEKFRRGTLLCFRKFLIPKNVRDKRGGGYHDFLSQLFCLTVPKNFVGEPLLASQNFQYRKNLWI